MTNLVRKYEAREVSEDPPSGFMTEWLAELPARVSPTVEPIDGQVITVEQALTLQEARDKEGQAKEDVSTAEVAFGTDSPAHKQTFRIRKYLRLAWVRKHGTKDSVRFRKFTALGRPNLDQAGSDAAKAPTKPEGRIQRHNIQALRIKKIEQKRKKEIVQDTKDEAKLRNITASTKPDLDEAGSDAAKVLMKRTAVRQRHNAQALKMKWTEQRSKKEIAQRRKKERVQRRMNELAQGMQDRLRVRKYEALNRPDLDQDSRDTEKAPTKREEARQRYDTWALKRENELVQDVDQVIDRLYGPLG